jgi:hypothetical protein
MSSGPKRLPVPVIAPAGEQPGTRIPAGLPRRRADSAPPGGSPGEQFDPFKFLIYAELAGAEIGPVE